MTLGEKLVFQRKKHGMTQEALASALNVSRQAVSKWELDQSQPDLRILSQLCDLFHVNADYLIRENADAATFAPNESVRPSSPSSLRILGIILLLSGLSLLICGFFLEDTGILVSYIGFTLAVSGTVLLLAHKDAALIAGWCIWVLFFIPLLGTMAASGTFLFPFFSTGSILSVILLLSLIALIRITSARRKGSKKS